MGKNYLLTILAVLSVLTIRAQQTVSVEDYDMITEQPDGDMRVYQRSGQVRFFDEENNKLDSQAQTGVFSIVFGPDGTVFLRDPVSRLTGYMSRGCWAKGTLSDDGRTITMPMGQYIDYIRSFDVVSVMHLFVYDSNQRTFVIDEDVKELTYTLNDDGTIVLNGTDQNHILSAVYRSFNGHEVGSQIDGRWCMSGDYESSYTLFPDQPVNLPAGLETDTFTLLATANDGIDWFDHQGTVSMAFDGDDVYVQGLCRFLPKTWVKGRLNGDSLTIEKGQYLGSYENLPLYFAGAHDGQAGAVMTDVVFTFDGESTYTTTDYVIINGEKDNLYVYLYYYGATITKVLDELVSPPEGLQTDAYVLTYRTYNANNKLVTATQFVNIGFVGNEVYMQRLWEALPEAWVKGRLENGQIVFDGPQYLGSYEDENQMRGAYFIPFNTTTGDLLSTITFDYDREAGVLSASEQAFGICLNRARLLTYVELYSPKLELIPDVAIEPATPAIISYIADDEVLPRITLSIPVLGVRGETIDPNKLSYQLFADVEQNIAPIVLTKELYERIPDEMDAIPWLYVDNYDVLMPSTDDVRLVYLNAPVADYNRIGVQSIYTGGGEETRSELVWYNIKDYSGIAERLQPSTSTPQPYYDLQGRKMTMQTIPQKGIYIVNGKKRFVQ